MNLGIALQDVMDGKGKRLEINVCPVLATELEVILEGDVIAIANRKGGVGKSTSIHTWTRREQAAGRQVNVTRTTEELVTTQ